MSEYGDKAYINGGLNVRAPNVTNGSGYYGQTCVAVCGGFTGSYNYSYLHLALPSRYNNSNNKMFRLHVKGYCLNVSANRIIDCIISGYVTTNNNGGPISSVSVYDATGQYSPAAYYSSNLNRAVARLYLPSSYYTSFRVEADQAGNGDVIYPGEIGVTWSTSTAI